MHLRCFLDYSCTSTSYTLSLHDALPILKKIQKRIKKDYQLALDLYDSGVYDAMYLARLVADDKRMTQCDLQRWAEDRKSTRLNSSHVSISYAVFCLKKKKSRATFT